MNIKTYMTTCARCGKEYEAIRSTSLYCSASCRQMTYARKVNERYKKYIQEQQKGRQEQNALSNHHTVNNTATYKSDNSHTVNEEFYRIANKVLDRHMASTGKDIQDVSINKISEKEPGQSLSVNKNSPTSFMPSTDMGLVSTKNIHTDIKQELSINKKDHVNAIPSTNMGLASTKSYHTDAILKDNNVNTEAYAADNMAYQKAIQSMNQELKVWIGEVFSYEAKEIHIIKIASLIFKIKSYWSVNKNKLPEDYSYTSFIETFISRLQNLYEHLKSLSQRKCKFAIDIDFRNELDKIRAGLAHDM